jgi:hypothetical protein
LSQGASLGTQLTFASARRRIKAETAMNKPWIIVAGACGLMVSGLVVKHFRSADSTGAAAPKTLEAFTSTPGAQHSGWLANEDDGAGGTAARSRGLFDKGKAGADGLGAGRGSSRGWASRDARGGMAAGGGWSGSGWGSSADYSGSDPIHAETNAPLESGGVATAGQSLRDTHGQTNAPGAGSEEVVKKTDDPASADPNAPVLSLFNDSPDQDKGDQPVINDNVTCDSSTGECTFDTDSRYAVPDGAGLTGEAGTISFCLQPQWGGDPTTNAGLVDLATPNIWENRLKIFKNGRFLRFSIWPNTGIESGAATTIDNWQSGQWHPVTVTFGQDPNTGANMASMYVDGVMVSQQSYDGQLEVPQQPLYIGSDMPQGEPAANGTMSNFQAYNRVVTPAEAASFAAGCPQ